MTEDPSWTEKVLAAKGWWRIHELLTNLLYHDVYEIRPFSKIGEHPCWIPVLEWMRRDKEVAIATLIGYLENFDVLGQWSLVLLPQLTGQDPVPAHHKDDELFLQLHDWLDWAEREGIEPIL